jgi:hypothetical protein
MAKNELEFELPQGVYGELGPDRFITDKDLEPPVTVPVLGWSPDVSFIALLLKKPGDRSGIIPVNREMSGQEQKATDFFLLELIERRKAEPVQSWEQVREQLEKDYLQEESARLAGSRAETVDAALEQVIGTVDPSDATAAVDLKLLAREQDVEYSRSGRPFTLDSYYSVFPRINNPVWILRTIPKMKPGEFSGLIENKNRVWEQYGPILERKRRIKMTVPEGYYIVHLLSKSEPDPAQLGASRDAIAKRLARTRRGQDTGGFGPVLESWIETLKQQAKVEKSKTINEVLLREKERAEGIVSAEKTD